MGRGRTMADHQKEEALIAYHLESWESGSGTD